MLRRKDIMQKEGKGVDELDYAKKTNNKINFIQSEVEATEYNDEKEAIKEDGLAYMFALEEEVEEIAHKHGLDMEEVLCQIGFTKEINDNIEQKKGVEQNRNTAIDFLLSEKTSEFTYYVQCTIERIKST